jgi:hypothetical protein
MARRAAFTRGRQNAGHDARGLPHWRRRRAGPLRDRGLGDRQGARGVHLSRPVPGGDGRLGRGFDRGSRARVPQGGDQRRRQGHGPDRAIRGAAPERRRQRAAGAARRSAGDGVPAPGVEGAAADPAGLDPDLLGDCGGDRPADGVAGGGARLRHQPPCSHRPLPSRSSRRQGGTGGYRWGKARKARLLRLEAEEA